MQEVLGSSALRGVQQVVSGGLGGLLQTSLLQGEEESQRRQQRATASAAQREQGAWSFKTEAEPKPEPQA